MNRIVTIGGGTGSFTLLSGIKTIPDFNISAIVAMTDDGGSTGVLRDELGVLPPGDVRQCLVALAADDRIMRDLMSYRFDSGTLSGHSLGNIFLAALEKVTGNFVDGIEFASKILKINGKVIPVTCAPSVLSIELTNKKLIVGEDKINRTSFENTHVSNIIVDSPINPDAACAIAQADYIFIGPGNHYCSILPNMAVTGFSDAVARSRAKIIYIANLTNKRGHTTHYSLSNYVDDIERGLGRAVDTILVNTTEPTAEQLEHYIQQEGESAKVPNDMFEDTRVVGADLLSTKVHPAGPHDTCGSLRALIRHDSEKLAQVLSQLCHKEARHIDINLNRGILLSAGD